MFQQNNTPPVKFERPIPFTEKLHETNGRLSTHHTTGLAQSRYSVSLTSPVATAISSSTRILSSHMPQLPYPSCELAPKRFCFDPTVQLDNFPKNRFPMSSSSSSNYVAHLSHNAPSIRTSSSQVTKPNLLRTGKVTSYSTYPAQRPCFLNSSQIRLSAIPNTSISMCLPSVTMVTTSTSSKYNMSTESVASCQQPRISEAFSVNELSSCSALNLSTSGSKTAISLKQPVRSPSSLPRSTVIQSNQVLNSNEHLDHATELSRFPNRFIPPVVSRPFFPPFNSISSIPLVSQTKPVAYRLRSPIKSTMMTPHLSPDLSRLKPEQPFNRSPFHHHPNLEISSHLSFTSTYSNDRPSFGTDIQFYLVDPVFSLSATEKRLWERHFFGHQSPAQLIYTLLYLVTRVLGIRTRTELRYELNDCFQFVLINHSPSPPSTSNSKFPWGTEYKGPISLLNSNWFHADYSNVLKRPHLRLLYIPNKNNVDSLSAKQNPGGANAVDRLTSLGLEEGLLVRHLKTWANNRKDGQIGKVGYLLGHFPVFDHGCCLTCMHAFYLSKRPKSRGPKSDAYFLTWSPNLSDDLWFRNRPIGATYLSEILRIIVAVLHWTDLSPGHPCLFPSELLSRNHSVTGAIVPEIRSWIGSCSTSQLDVPSVITHTVDNDEPVNLVVRECASLLKQAHLSSSFGPPTLQHQNFRGTHPTCLDYWPELTERARQTTWQCSDCKSCTLCQQKEFTNELLVCDACDKGFHSDCHVPKLEEPVDRNLPWVCSECEKEGYSIAMGTLPNMSEMDASAAESLNTTTEKNIVSVDSEKQEGTEKVKSTEEMMKEEYDSRVSIDSKVECRNELSSTTVDKKSDADLKQISSTINQTTPLLSTPRDSVHSNVNASPSKISTPNGSGPSVCHTASSNASLTVENTSTNLPAKSDSTIQPNHEDTSDASSSEAKNPAPLRSNSPQIRPNDVRGWSVDHVSDWLLEEGFPREAEAFLQQEIDGACLLLMKRMDVLTELGIKLGPAVKIYERIKGLQSRCTSPTVLNA